MKKSKKTPVTAPAKKPRTAKDAYDEMIHREREKAKKPTKEFWDDLHDLALTARRLVRKRSFKLGNLKPSLLLLPGMEMAVSNALAMLKLSAGKSKADQRKEAMEESLAQSVEEVLRLEKKVKESLRRNKAMEMRFASTPLNPKLYAKVRWTDEKDQVLASLPITAKPIKLKAKWCDESVNPAFTSMATKPDKLDPSPYKRVGYWRSADGKDFLECPVVQECIDRRWFGRERNQVILYLKLKHKFAADYMGSSTCRICGDINNGSADKTDGTWVWPEGLPHYIIIHFVKPPQEFIDHCLKQWKERKK
jgi:hypothetical protein